MFSWSNIKERYTSSGRLG